MRIPKVRDLVQSIQQELEREPPMWSVTWKPVEAPKVGGYTRATLSADRILDMIQHDVAKHGAVEVYMVKGYGE